MKVTAAVLAVIFSGSYISCIVQKALDSQKDSESRNADIMAADQCPVPDVTSVSVLQTVPDLMIPQTASVSSSLSTSVSSVTTAARSSAVTSALLQTETEMVTGTTVTAAVTSVSSKETTVPATEPPAVTTQPETQPAPPPQTEPPVAEPPQLHPADPGYPVAESPAVDASYLNRCAFVGDSHMVRMGMYNIVSKDRVFAEVGLSLKYLADKISVSDIREVSPENIYIMMGTNGIAWMSYDYMLNQYVSYVNSLEQAMPGVKIYIMSIPPVGANIEAKSADSGQRILNSAVNSYNERLMSMARDNGWYYIDVNPSLRDENGYLNKSTDGIHMPSEMYAVLKDYLLTHTVS